VKKYSWANGKDDFYVICHNDGNFMSEHFPYGICSPVFGASKWELIDILEEQDNAIEI
jgi:hypothetical protein